MRRFDQGFSLIEVAMSLAIIAFACVSMLGLIPMGIASFHQAMNNTVESSIVQNLTNNILLTSFSNLPSMASSNSTSYYFDGEGTLLNSATGAVYTAQITFSDVSPNSGGANNSTTAKNPLNNLSSGRGNTAVIQITKVFAPNSPDKFSVIVASDRQL